MRAAAPIDEAVAEVDRRVVDDLRLLIGEQVLVAAVLRDEAFAHAEPPAERTTRTATTSRTKRVLAVLEVLVVLGSLSSCLLHRHALRQVPRLVDVGSSSHAD